MAVEGPLFAIVTPFAESDLSLDEAALRASLQFLIDKGATDVVSCGTTGEFASMNLDERKRVTEIVAEECHGLGVRVVCHISCCDVSSSIQLARHAQQVKCEAVLLLPPYYFHAAEPAGVEAFFESVVRAVELPVFLYNFPKHTGNSIPADMYARLAAAHTHIVGIKDSSGTLDSPLSFAAAVPSGKVFVGNDKAAAQVYAARLTGSITGASTCVPEPLIALAQAASRHDAAAVAAAQQQINEWHELLDSLSAVEIPKVKAVLSHRLSTPYPLACRPPLVGIGQEEKELMRQWLLARHFI